MRAILAIFIPAVFVAWGLEELNVLHIHWNQKGVDHVFEHVVNSAFALEMKRLGGMLAVYAVNALDVTQHAVAHLSAGVSDSHLLSHAHRG